MTFAPVTTHQLYTSQKHVELVCGFYGMKHPKCKMAREKDDELYKNFILQFDSRNKHEQSRDLEQGRDTVDKRQEMDICGDSGSNHNRIGDHIRIVEEKK